MPQDPHLTAATDAVPKSLMPIDLTAPVCVFPTLHFFVDGKGPKPSKGAAIVSGTHVVVTRKPPSSIFSCCSNDRPTIDFLIPIARVTHVDVASDGITVKWDALVNQVKCDVRIVDPIRNATTCRQIADRILSQRALMQMAGVHLLPGLQPREVAAARNIAAGYAARVQCSQFFDVDAVPASVIDAAVNFDYDLARTGVASVTLPVYNGLLAHVFPELMERASTMGRCTALVVRCRKASAPVTMIFPFLTSLSMAEHIDFANATLPRQLSQFFEAAKLVSLKLSDGVVSTSVLQLLSTQLPVSSLTELSLTQAGLHDAHAPSITGIVSRCTSLRVLDLRGNPGWQNRDALYSAVSQTRTNLKQLFLDPSSVPLTYAGYAACKSSPVLAGVCETAKALVASPEFAVALAKGHPFTDVDSALVGGSPMMFTALLDANTSISLKLDVMRDEALLDALARYPHVERRTTGLRVDLSCSGRATPQLLAFAIEAVAPSVANTSVTSVFIDPSAWPSLSVGIATSIQLCTAPNLAELRIPGGAFGPKIVEIFARLHTNTTLRTLDVSHHGFGDVGATALGQMLRKNRTLTEVHYDGNKITREGLRHIRGALYGNAKLTMFSPPTADVNAELNSMTEKMRACASLESQHRAAMKRCYKRYSYSVAGQRRNMQLMVEQIVQRKAWMRDITAFRALVTEMTEAVAANVAKANAKQREKEQQRRQKDAAKELLALEKGVEKAQRQAQRDAARVAAAAARKAANPQSKPSKPKVKRADSDDFADLGKGAGRPAGGAKPAPRAKPAARPAAAVVPARASHAPPRLSVEERQERRRKEREALRALAYQKEHWNAPSEGKWRRDQIVASTYGERELLFVAALAKQGLVLPDGGIRNRVALSEILIALHNEYTRKHAKYTRRCAQLSSRPLPVEYLSKSENGRTYFVDVEQRTATWADPRVINPLARPPVFHVALWMDPALSPQQRYAYQLIEALHLRCVVMPPPSSPTSAELHAWSPDPSYLARRVMSVTAAEEAMYRQHPSTLLAGTKQQSETILPPALYLRYCGYKRAAVGIAPYSPASGDFGPPIPRRENSSMMAVRRPPPDDTYITYNNNTDYYSYDSDCDDDYYHPAATIPPPDQGHDGHDGHHDHHDHHDHHCRHDHHDHHCRHDQGHDGHHDHHGNHGCGDGDGWDAFSQWGADVAGDVEGALGSAFDVFTDVYSAMESAVEATGDAVVELADAGIDLPVDAYAGADVSESDTSGDSNGSDRDSDAMADHRSDFTLESAPRLSRSRGVGRPSHCVSSSGGRSLTLDSSSSSDCGDEYRRDVGRHSCRHVDEEHERHATPTHPSAVPVTLGDAVWCAPDSVKMTSDQLFVKYFDLVHDIPEQERECVELVNVRREHSGSLAERFTVVTQCSADRLDRLRGLMDSADCGASVSAAVFEPATADDGQRQVFAQQLAELGHDTFQRNQGLSHVLITLVRRSARPGDDQFYPINVCRNAALDAASTPTVLLVDVDFALSRDACSSLGARPDLLDYIASSRTALVLPAFEVNARKESTMPLTRERILQSTRKGHASAFHVKHYPKGHRASQYDRWLECQRRLADMDPHAHGVNDQECARPYEVIFEEGYEPYVVCGRSQIPRYDTRFTGYGFNKVQHLLHLAAMKFNFYVDPLAFVAAFTHARSDDWLRTFAPKTESSDELEAALMQKFMVQGLFQRFKRECHWAA